MMEVSGETNSDVSQWETQISKDLHVIIESRLRGVVEEQHRQHAIWKLLEYLQSTANALAKTRGFNSDISKPLQFVQDDVYELHEMRMLLRRSNRITTAKRQGSSVDMEEDDSSCLVEQLPLTVNLLTWLMKHFWADSFFISSYATLGDSYMNRENTSFSESWLRLLDIMSNFLDEVEITVESIKCDSGDTKHRTELRRSLHQLSEILQALQKGRGQQSSGVLSDESTGCRTAGHISEEKAGNFTVVDERLEGYDDLFLEILSNPVYYEKSHWLSFLERNEDLLVDGRFLLSLHEVLLFQGQSVSSIIPKLLEISLRCMSQLPLPIFLNIHEWLWSSSEKCQLYLSVSLAEWDLSLNKTFNKLTNSDRSKLAVQIGCLLIQQPESTLQRTLLHVAQNQEAVGTLSEVVACLPMLREFSLPGRRKSLLFAAISECLLSEVWKTKEETNILKFVVSLCQESDFFDCPFKQPPVLSCDQLVLELILASLFPERPATGGTMEKLMPLERCLKLLNGLLQPGLIRHVSHKLLYSSLMSLCQLLDCNSKRWSEVRDLCIEDIQLACKGITFLNSDGESSCIMCQLISYFTDALDLIVRVSPLVTNDEHAKLPVLWQSLGDFHWSIKLLVAAELKTLGPYLKEYCNDCLDAIQQQLRLLSHLEDHLTKEEELAIWDSILQACSTSEDIAEKCSQIVTAEATSPGNDIPRSSKALTVALAGHIERCTVAEWKLTLVVVRSLLTTVTMVTYSSEFTGYLPLNIQGISADLQLSQILLSVLEVKSILKSNCWVHIVKCYLLAMQEVLQMRSDIASDTHSRLFLAGQVFCHACESLGLIPNMNHKALVVLVYEALGQLEQKERSKVTEWHLIHADMIKAAKTCLVPSHDRDTLVKKVQTLR